MFAVIKTGGKQYRVEAGDVIVVEKLPVEENGAVTFDEVLMAGDKVGTPLVEGAKVSGTVLSQTRDKKVIVFKKKRRQNYRRKHGHRQHISVVRITDIAVA
ncbi:50S ribosomal subunit protein L21 [uncultured Alphaproteobacteria bacterium]|jgi:large subunit ribosomal protein L21|uniref:Large ribosomal subunit protein bL21 n=1 Tax=uncultured Alphaproteobacteria bacterium TaxID=91750 RepID=A0A212K0P8_9PROT|nr:50S ribosomal subunit protein L21 [uncultured Alphaproteobacteria bacterium]